MLNVKNHKKYGKRSVIYSKHLYALETIFQIFEREILSSTV